jgi:hypothetical protein
MDTFLNETNFAASQNLCPEKDGLQLLKKKAFFEAIHKTRFDDAAEECDLPCAPIKITNSSQRLRPVW